MKNKDTDPSSRAVLVLLDTLLVLSLLMIVLVVIVLARM